jgi:hypothetical protein
MRNILFILTVGFLATQSFATILWEAHYNNGTKNADYSASGTVAPWGTVQSNTPLVNDGYTGGAVEPIVADMTNLNYPVSQSSGTLNLSTGTLTVRVRPNFDSTTASNSGTVLCLANSYSEDRRRFVNLYYNATSDKWQVVLGRLADSPSPTALGLASSEVTFSSGDWIQLGFAWEQVTGNYTIYVNGVAQTTGSAGAGYWSTSSGAYSPWAMTIGNIKSAGNAPYGGQFDGTIDDVVISDVYQDTAIFSRVPEPATMGLLAIGGLGVVLRRKR